MRLTHEGLESIIINMIWMEHCADGHVWDSSPQCANHHARIALWFTDLRAANGIAADPLNKPRRDRCSAAPAVDRKFRASFLSFFSSPQFHFRIWNEPWTSSFGWEEQVLRPSPFLNHSLDFWLYFFIKTSVSTMPAHNKGQNMISPDTLCMCSEIMETNLMCTPWYKSTYIQRSVI